MYIRVERKELLDAIAPCLCAVATKSANAVLSCLYFKADKDAGTVTITTFDTVKGVRREIRAEVEEEGQILLDALKFNSMIRSLPEGEITVFNDANFVTTISSGTAKFEILGQSADSFPPLPLLQGEKKFVISQGTLKKMLQQVIFACAVIDLKPILTGVLFETKEDKLRLCACDGYRISLRDENCVKGLLMDSSFVVPAKSLQELIKLLSDDEEEGLRVELAGRHIIFMFESFTFFSRYMDARDYIAYQNSLPQSCKTTVQINLADAVGCLERCSLLIDERAKSPVRIEIEEEGIHVKCTTANGKIDERLTCEVKGEGMTIGFNNKFLLDALRGAKDCGDEEVVWELNSPLSGMVVRSPEKDNYYYMVVPMRLN